MPGYSRLDPKAIGFTVIVALALLVTFMPLSPMEEARPYETTITVKSTTTIPGVATYVTGTVTINKPYVVGWMNCITCPFVITVSYYQQYLYYGTRKVVIDVFDRIDRYVKTPQSDTVFTIVLYKDGSVHDTIRNVYAFDLQEREIPTVVVTTGVIQIPPIEKVVDVEKPVTRTTTTTKNVNVWAASGIPSSVGALISLMIIGAIVMMALFVKPSPPPAQPPPPVVQAGPAYVSAPPRVMGPTISGRGAICFGCGATIPSGATSCPRCGKPA